VKESLELFERTGNFRGKRKEQAELPRKKPQPREQSAVMLNVDIPSNRERFIAHFREQVQHFLEEARKKKARNEDFSQEMSGEPSFRQPEVDYSQLAREEHELVLQVPKNYYYKRWIWLQFPWVCQSLRVDYSKQLMQCFSSATKYMSVSE
jgi:hypothetical protein